MQALTGVIIKVLATFDHHAFAFGPADDLVQEADPVDLTGFINHQRVQWNTGRATYKPEAARGVGRVVCGGVQPGLQSVTFQQHESARRFAGALDDDIARKRQLQLAKGTQVLNGLNRGIKNQRGGRLIEFAVALGAVAHFIVAVRYERAEHLHDRGLALGRRLLESIEKRPPSRKCRRIRETPVDIRQWHKRGITALREKCREQIEDLQPRACGSLRENLEFFVEFGVCAAQSEVRADLRAGRQLKRRFKKVVSGVVPTLRRLVVASTPQRLRQRPRKVGQKGRTFPEVVCQTHAALPKYLFGFCAGNLAQNRGRSQQQGAQTIIYANGNFNLVQGCALQGTWAVPQSSQL